MAPVVQQGRSESGKQKQLLLGPLERVREGRKQLQSGIGSRPIVGGDGNTHQVEVNASSLYDAADQAIQASGK